MASFEIKKKWTSDGAKLEDSSGLSVWNMALVGSDLDKNARKSAAEKESAWTGCGSKVGLEIWRVEKMEIKKWPAEEYGRFYEGDSYIILVTTKDKASGKLLHDIHFWLGKTTSQDEMGVAAYKTVELDDFLDQEPHQHREVMRSESLAFTKLFKQITYLTGGIESGFNHIEAGTYVSKLLQVRKLKHTIKVIEVPCTRASLNHDDCFVLDTGTALYPWFGDHSSAFEKAKAGTVAQNLEARRHGKSQVRTEPDAEFWAVLGGEGPIAADGEAKPVEEFGEGVLYKLSDESGKLMCVEVSRGNLTKSMLGSDDVYMLDVGMEIFCYIGANASDAEHRNAMSTAVSYLGTCDKPLNTPIHVLKEGSASYPDHWAKVFAD